MKTLTHIILAMRPNQWTKNLVLFAGVVFSKNFLHTRLVLRSFQGFIIFCLLSGAVYILNDVFDRDKDRKHPEKIKRPVASGALGVGSATAVSVVIILAAALYSWFIGREFFLFMAFFLFVNLAYTLALRDIVILDVIGISLSFIARAGAGVAVLHPVIPSVEFSPWLWICTFFLSLFLAICKRRNEFLVLEEASSHRKSLAEYSEHLLDQLVGLTATSTIVSYSIYTVWPGTIAKFGTNMLVLTIPFVIFGIMRYLYLVYRKNKGGDPSSMLLTEKQIMVDIFLWIIVTAIIIYKA